MAETAYLTDAKIKVPVKIVKKEGGNNYYAIVDPETMELLEGIYTIQKGELKLISERPNKWSHKADINNPDTASPQSVKENRPCRQPFPGSCSLLYARSVSSGVLKNYVNQDPTQILKVGLSEGDLSGWLVISDLQDVSDKAG